MRAARMLRGSALGVAMALALGAAGLMGCHGAARRGGCGAPCATPCAQPGPCTPPSPCAAPTAAATPCEPVTGGWPPNRGAQCGEVWCLFHKAPITCPETQLKVICPERCAPSCVPAVRERITGYSLVKPAQVRYVTIPARYECFTETYVACPPKTKWVCSSKEDACGCRKEFWCLKATPAKLATRTKRVMVQPESVQAVWECAQYRDCTQCVVTRPAHENSYPVEPVFERCTRTKLVCPESYEWRRNSSCEVPTAP